MSYKKEFAHKIPGLHRGFFLTLEGLDGAGKTTQLHLVAEALRERGLDPLPTREPTSGPWGQKIRELARRGRQGVRPEDELDFFVRDRAEDVEAFAPAALAGRPVLADRYILSNIAYQSALGLDPELILKRNAAFPWPDLIIILEIPVEEGLRRIAQNREGGLDAAFEQRDYLEKVRKIFDRPDHPGKIVRLDGLADPAEITRRILEEIDRRFLGETGEGGLEIIDSHCHLSSEAFPDDLEAVVGRARAAGVRAMLNVGLGPENSAEVLRLAETYPQLHPVLGWHPHEANQLTPAGLRELFDLAQRPEVVAFGEIGLDFALMHSERATQLRVFESLLEAAGDLNRPIVVHSRDAQAETLALLKKYAPKLKRGGVIHCFALGWDEARAFLDLGFHLSLPGVITYAKSAALREAAAKIPADRLLVETDAPYLSPEPYRGRRNEPAYLPYHLQALAEARGLSLSEAARLTAANARRLFRIL
ncbi:MAG: dTMP kinase [Candidatus Adiutrix sp.]|nr:dTMP kinase [Candidatus Adiutrix sp.]